MIVRFHERGEAAGGGGVMSEERAGRRMLQSWRGLKRKNSEANFAGILAELQEGLRGEGRQAALR